MAITLLKGEASKVSRGSDYTYAATANQGPVAIKNQLVSLRLGQNPVSFRSRTLVSISDGDLVAAAGANKNGTLEALALRNLTTGAVYHPPTTMAMVLAGALVLLGLPLIAFLGIGLFFIGIGGWILYKGMQTRKAVGMLAQLGAG